MKQLNEIKIMTKEQEERIYNSLFRILGELVLVEKPLGVHLTVSAQEIMNQMKFYLDINGGRISFQSLEKRVEDYLSNNKD